MSNTKKNTGRFVVGGQIDKAALIAAIKGVGVPDEMPDAPCEYTLRPGVLSTDPDWQVHKEAYPHVTAPPKSKGKVPNPCRCGSLEQWRNICREQFKTTDRHMRLETISFEIFSEDGRIIEGSEMWTAMTDSAYSMDELRVMFKMPMIAKVVFEFGFALGMDDPMESCAFNNGFIATRGGRVVYVNNAATAATAATAGYAEDDDDDEEPDESNQP